jgi:hypothetical protein
MSKKITELNQPPISSKEFDEWKRNWDNISPIPDQIHDYMKRVVFVQVQKSLDELNALIRAVK